MLDNRKNALIVDKNVRFVSHHVSLHANRWNNLMTQFLLAVVAACTVVASNKNTQPWNYVIKIFSVGLFFVVLRKIYGDSELNKLCNIT